MSELVTWELCPRCGGLAAVGWVLDARSGGAPAENRPVEFDCPAGCHVGLDVLTQVYRLMHRSPPESAEESR